MDNVQGLSISFVCLQLVSEYALTHVAVMASYDAMGSRTELLQCHC